MEYALSHPVIARADTFANDVLPTNLGAYKGRNQTDPATIFEQIKLGKIAEQAVYYTLKERGLYLTEPDFSIYKGRRKSYAPDITINADIPLHVKAMSDIQAARFGLSWTFQYGGNSQDSEIFTPPYTGYVAFCEVKGLERKVIIHGIPLVSCLHMNKMWRDPKIARLKGIKTVIYAEDLFRLDDSERWQLLGDMS